MAVLVLVAALAGVGIGRTWPSTSSSDRTQSTPTIPPSATSPGGTTAPGSSGGSTNPYTGAPAFGSPGGTSGGSSTQTGAGGPSAATAAAVAKKVDPDLVDINTDLSIQKAEAAGTGIVLTSDGLILTNNHVIDGATSISVRDIGNNRIYTATVVGYDESSDVALLQLNGASGLKTASIGDSSAVKIGTPVVALGNAGGAGGLPSVAPGAVTGLNESINANDEGNGTSENLKGLIQINSDIQPGDSGGSLVSTEGVVLGMDTAALEVNGAATGSQGFAIPINTATSIGKLIKNSEASSTVHIGPTAFLGIEYSATNNSVAAVVPGTAAQKAGLIKGDIITSFGGKTITSPSSLTKLLVGYHPGEQVTIGWTTSSGAAGHASVALGTGPAA